MIRTAFFYKDVYLGGNWYFIKYGNQFNLVIKSFNSLNDIPFIMIKSVNPCNIARKLGRTT